MLRGAPGAVPDGERRGADHPDLYLLGDRAVMACHHGIGAGRLYLSIQAGGMSELHVFGLFPAISWVRGITPPGPAPRGRTKRPQRGSDPPVAIP